MFEFNLYDSIPFNCGYCCTIYHVSSSHLWSFTAPPFRYTRVWKLRVGDFRFRRWSFHGVFNWSIIINYRSGWGWLSRFGIHLPVWFGTIGVV
jgi:hypothetical protein